MVTIELFNTKAWYLAKNNDFKTMLNLYKDEVDQSDLDSVYKNVLKERLTQLEKKVFYI